MSTQSKQQTTDSNRLYQPVTQSKPQSAESKRFHQYLKDEKLSCSHFKMEEKQEAPEQQPVEFISIVEIDLSKDTDLSRDISKSVLVRDSSYKHLIDDASVQ